MPFRPPAACRLIGTLLSVAAFGCDRSEPEPARVEAPADTARAAVAYLTYGNGELQDTLRAGQAGELVHDAVEVRLDVGGVTTTESLRRHLRVEPAGLLEQEPRWSEYLNTGVFSLRRLPADREVTVTLLAGLTRQDGVRFASDQVWRLRRVESTAVTVAVDGPGVLRYRHGRYLPATGIPVEEESVFFVPERSVRVELDFSRPMEREQVEAHLQAAAGEGGGARVEWADSARSVASLTFATAGGGFLDGITRHLDLEGLVDARGLTLPDAPLLVFEVGEARAFYGWSPENEPRRLAAAPPRLLVFAHRASVGPAGALIWHFEEEVGDYAMVTPWLVDPASGAYRRIGEPQAASEMLAAQWLPGGARAAVQQHPDVLLVDSGGATVSRISAGDAVDVVQFAANPRDGRIALLTRPQQFAGENPPVGVRVIDAADSTTAEVARVSDLAFHEDGSPESLSPLWLPDGRLAFLRRVGSRWRGEEEVPRHLALLDPARDTIVETTAAATAIFDVDADGRILLDGNRLRDAASGNLQRLRPPQGVRLVAISPDGAWIAGHGGRDAELGVLRRADGRWRGLGRGTLLGWGPDGTLYWLGLAAAAAR